MDYKRTSRYGGETRKENFQSGQHTFTLFTYIHFVHSGIHSTLAKHIWKVKCLMKVRVLLWLIAKNTILTWPKPQKRDCLGPDICMLCNAMEEFTDHLMMNWEFAIQVWNASSASGLGILTDRPYKDWWYVGEG